MGKLVQGLGVEDPAFASIHGFDCSGDVISQGLQNCDILDPTSMEATFERAVTIQQRPHALLIITNDPSAVVQQAEIAAKYGINVVVGTTGLADAHLLLLSHIARTVAVLQTTNFSRGVTVLKSLAAKAAAAMGIEFGVEIVEIHHGGKEDAPSGTALTLANVVADARGQDFDEVSIYGRKGKTGKRPLGQICVHALRGGDVAGEHTVHFLGAGERLELTHKASSRENFAHGALAAVKFIADKPAGLYSMEAVYGL